MSRRDVIFSAVLIGLASAVIGTSLADDWHGLVMALAIALPPAIVLYFVAADD